MKPFVIKPFLLALAASAILGIGAHASAQETNTALTINGEVVKSGCLSHKAKFNDAKECTESYAHGHGKYVLFDKDSNMTYRIKDQKQAAEFAGHDVMVAGYLDRSARVLHITDIVPVS